MPQLCLHHLLQTCRCKKMNQRQTLSQLQHWSFLALLFHSQRELNHIPTFSLGLYLPQLYPLLPLQGSTRQRKPTFTSTVNLKMSRRAQLNLNQLKPQKIDRPHLRPHAIYGLGEQVMVVGMCLPICQRISDDSPGNTRFLHMYLHILIVLTHY